MRILMMLLLLFSRMAFAAEIEPKIANPSLIRIIPVEPTPEADNVTCKIVFPREGQSVYNPVKLQFQLRGFPVGVGSDFERKKEIFDDPNGQSLLVFVDNYQPIEIYESFLDALDDSNLYFDLTLTTTLPFYLNEGMHVIRAFPDRSYGESLKGKGCFAAGIFYIGGAQNNLNVNLNAPYLTYNEPLETLVYPEGRPLLLDFYISNIQLSKDGYKVRVVIDGNIERTLTSWVPYYIYGLPIGMHSIRLQLLDEKNQIVPGLFNDVIRSIRIQ